MAKMLSVIAVILSVLGALIVCFNLYVGFIRYGIHQLRHRDEKFQYVSGIPVLGSLFLWTGALLLWWLGHGAWAIAAFILSLLDTSGLHWFLYSQAFPPRPKN